MRTQSNCPQCGAPMEFLFSNAVQTTCPYCNSILVRTDLDLKRVGEMSDIAADASPIQLRTEGIYRNKAFQVVGRIAYVYEGGNWNEWHLGFQDGSSGWLSDAQLDYAISFAVKDHPRIPPVGNIGRGWRMKIRDAELTVTTITKARYGGVEGELPFEYWDKTEMMFADLRSASRGFGTIDYSEDPPLFFLGEAVEFDELKLRNLREFEGW